PLSPPTTPPRPSPPACRPYCVPDPPPPPPCPTRRSSDLSGRHLPAAAGRRPDAPVPVVGSYLECMPNDAPTRGTRSGAPLAVLPARSTPRSQHSPLAVLPARSFAKTVAAARAEAAVLAKLRWEGGRVGGWVSVGAGRWWRRPGRSPAA